MAATDNAKRLSNPHDVRRTAHYNASASTEYFEGPYVLFYDGATGALVKTSAAGANKVVGTAVRYYKNLVASVTTTKPVEVQFDYVERITLTGVVVADVRRKVYATDDNTFTTTAAGASYVGYIVNFITTNTCEVLIEGTTV